MIIAITGTPATGKSTLAKKLAKKLKYQLLDVNEFLKTNETAISGYDRERDSLIIDTNKLNKDIQEYIKENGWKFVVIDSHLSHELPKSFVDLVVVTRCDLKVLKKRLEERKYSDNKVKENMDAETFDICKTEAQENGHNIHEIDTLKKNSFDKLLKLVEKLQK
jgi:adenylate kinase